MRIAALPGAARRRRSVLRSSTLALVVALGAAAAQAADPICTPAPARPSHAAVTDAEWKAAVHPNCFDDLQRVGHWIGQKVSIGHQQSPEKYFRSIAGPIRGGLVTVLVHGWAPGFRPAVDRAGGNLQWWSDGATDANGIWASDWAWVPFAGTDRPSTRVTETGFFQEIYQHVPQSLVLGYSWIDDSATLLARDTQLDLVYRSEAYTNVNGLRLAAALEKLLEPDFWKGNGRLHLIGHSHGSKVATVAALALQAQDLRVDRLTVLDSPESTGTLRANASNLLGFYLNQLHTRQGGAPREIGVFVDNYVSEFGAAFAGTGNADRVVDVVLNPVIFACSDLGNRHSYSAAWYAGAAAAAASARPPLPPIGLDWPPPQSPNTPALNQNDPSGAPWKLTAGPPGSLGCGFTAPQWSYRASPITITTYGTTGNVSGDPKKGLVFTADTGSGVKGSSFSGATSVYTWAQYGIAFDVEWTSPTAGDYLVVTGSVPGTPREQEVLLVMDGRSAVSGRHPVAINAEIGSWLDFEVHYLPAKGNRAGKVTLSDFRGVEVLDASSPHPAESEPRTVTGERPRALGRARAGRPDRNRPAGAPCQALIGDGLDEPSSAPPHQPILRTAGPDG